MRLFELILTSALYPVPRAPRTSYPETTERIAVKDFALLLSTRQRIYAALCTSTMSFNADLERTIIQRASLKMLYTMVKISF